MDRCKPTLLWRCYAALALCATTLWVLLLFTAIAGQGQDITIIPLDSVQCSATADSSHPDGPRPSLDRQPQRPCININSATAVQLQELPGIGAVLAQRIIDYRATQGAFKDLQALCKVKGIGPKTAARFSAQLCF